MSSPPVDPPIKPDRRYPKRQRTAVAYREATDSEDELGDDDESVTAITDNRRANGDEAGSSENEEDWGLNSKNGSKKSKTKEPEPFPFIPFLAFRKLAPELREEVYKLVVGSPDGIVPIEPSSLTNTRLRRTLEESCKRVAGAWAEFFDRKRFRNLRLLRVSKVIYQEAAVVLYTKHKFVFSRLSALQTFLLLLRPQTLDRLIHIQVTVGDSEWQFMPGVASQMLQLHYLQTLKISGLNYSTSSRNFGKYLNSTGRPQSTWKVNMESFDKMMGIKLARDVYPFMFPFFNAVMRAGPAAAEDTPPAASEDPESASSSVEQPKGTKDLDPATPPHGSGAHADAEDDLRYKPLVGVDALVRAVELDDGRHGGWYDNIDRIWGSSMFDQFRYKRLTEARIATRRSGMKEELRLLMAKDTF